MIPILKWIRKGVKWLTQMGKKDPIEDLPWSSVQSSCVSAVRYDGKERAMYVAFNDGAVYCYFNCPVAVAVAMLNSVSKGKFMWTDVRGRFVPLRTSPPTK